MPAAAIALSMLIALLATTSSDASPSCMSKTEARAHFRSMHIYWHGLDHCWDATRTGRVTHIHKAQRKPPISEAQRHVDQPNWHDSMSEMLPGDEPGQDPRTPWINRWVDIGSSKSEPDARWVDHAAVEPSPVIDRKPAPMVSPQVKLLALISVGIVLTLATIELLFRRTTAG